MDSLTEKPTVVIVPGSFSPPYFYNTFVSQLTAHKYDAVVVDLPSVGGKTAATMTDDAQAIQAVTSKVADEGKDIVLIMHSYGGVPGTESAHGVTKKEREALGKKGGVVALLYVTAFLVGAGKSLGSTMGEGAGVPDYVKVEVRGAFTSILRIILSSANLDFRSVFSLTLYPS
jgi:pimeloyl-ACP methyl ester carboxylesterase